MGTWFRSLDGLEGTRSLPCLSGVLDVEAWGSLDGELKLGRSAWPVVDQGHVVPIARRPGGKRGRSPVCPECSTSRPGDRSAPSWNSSVRPGTWSTRGTRSLPCLPGVLHVEASGSLDGELKLGRSAWPVVDQGNVVAPLSTRSLDVEASGSLDGELKLGRSTWHVVDQGNTVAPLYVRSRDVEASGSLGVELELGRSTWPRGRPGERGRSHVCAESRRQGLWIARRGAEARPLGLSPWSTRETWSLPCLWRTQLKKPARN
jgi:hypothetical protein